MAIGDDELDLEPLGRPRKSGIKRVFVIATVVIATVSVGGFSYFSSSISARTPDAEKPSGKTIKSQPAIYLDLEPSFVANFEYKDTLRYLQANISIMARDQAVIDQAILHMPTIRDRVLTLLSNRTYAELSGPARKEKLRLEMLIALRKIVGTSKSGHSIDTVYFTGYVMQ